MFTKTWWEITKRQPSMMHSRTALWREGRWQVSEYEQQGNEEPYRKHHVQPFFTKWGANREIKRITKARVATEMLRIAGFQIDSEEEAIDLHDELM